MADLLRLTKQYHETILRRIKATQLSSEQQAVHERILVLANQSSDANDLEQKKEVENLIFKLTQALSIDNWIAKSRAAEETGDKVAAKVFRDNADAARKAADNVTLSKSVDESSTKAMQILTEQEAVKTAFVDAIYAIFGYRVTHGANLARREELSKTFRIHLSTISSKGSKFEELIDDSFYRDLVPLSQAQWDTVLEVYRAISSPVSDKNAQAKLTQEAKQAQSALFGKSGELKAVQQHIETSGTRAAYLAIAPQEEPGPYTFEKIWEGGRDE